MNKARARSMVCPKCGFKDIEYLPCPRKMLFLHGIKIVWDTTCNRKGLHSHFICSPCSVIYKKDEFGIRRTRRGCGHRWVSTKP